MKPLHARALIQALHVIDETTLELTLNGKGLSESPPGDFTMSVRIRAHRALLKDFAVGNFFNIDVGKQEG